MAFDAYFEALADTAFSENRYLIYWSQYEEKVVELFLPNRVLTRIKPHLYNLLPPARKYANRRRSFGVGGSASKKSLEEFFAALYRKRSPFPPLALGAAEVCRRLDKACAKTQRWSNFTDKQKKYAKDLLAYNQGDCRATWLIARRLGNALGKKN
jgi:predicted RecB family nuclease